MKEQNAARSSVQLLHVNVFIIVSVAVTRIFFIHLSRREKNLLTSKPRISSHNDKMFADMFFALLVANSLILLRRLDNFF